MPCQDTVIAVPVPKAKAKARARAEPNIHIKINPNSTWNREIPAEFVKEEKGNLNSIKNMTTEDIKVLMDFYELPYNMADKKDMLWPVLREHLWGLVSLSTNPSVALATPGSDTVPLPANIIVVKLIRIGPHKGTKEYNDAAIRSHFCLDWTAAEAKAFMTSAFTHLKMQQCVVNMIRIEGWTLPDDVVLRATCLKRNGVVRYYARKAEAKDLFLS